MIRLAQIHRHPDRKPRSPPPRGTRTFMLAAIFIFLLVCVAIGFQKPTPSCGPQACAEHATR